MDTKEQILETSLSLFAKKGYVATSVRDIGKYVGIKDSSLYFHFKNKQAIMESLKDKFIERSNMSVENIRQGIQKITCMKDEIFLNVTIGYIESYLMEPFINKFIRVLIHEQGDNKESRNLYQEWCIRNPVVFQTELIIKLQEIGFLKKMDPKYLAEAYYSPIFLYFNEHMTYDEEIEKQKKQFLNRVQNHVNLYLKEYEV